MALTWGPWEGSGFGQFRVGMNPSVSGTSITVRYYVESNGGAADTQTMNRGGSISSDFTYFFEQPSGGGQQLVATTTITGKTPGSTYTFTASISGVYSGATPSHSVTATVPPVEPSAPGTPVISNITASQARSDWAAPSSNGGASIVEYSSHVSKSSTFASGVTYFYATARADILSGLDPASTYYTRVRARNSAGWGPLSGTRSFVTLAATPSACGTPSVSSITSSSFNYSFTAPSDNGGATVTDYQLQRATNSGFTTGVVTVDPGSDRAGSLSGLTRATTYYLRARAGNSAGWGAWSNTRTTATLPEAPTMGTGYSASSITRNSTVIIGSSVTDNGGESPTNLRVQYNTSASATGATVYTRGAWAQPTLTGLTADTPYYYRVAAYNSGGWSEYGPWKTFTTLDSAPDDMAPPTFDDITDTEMTVEWVAPSMNGATFISYRYEASLDDGFSALVASGSTTNLSVTLTGLTSGLTYYVRVRASATPDNGGWGVASQATTGVAPNAGLRAYTFIGGVRYEGELYTFVGGTLKQIRVMYQHDGTMETE